MRQISVVAVIVSWVVDIGGTSLAGGIFVAWALFSGRVSAEVASDSTALTNDPQVGPALMAIGMAFSVIAGLVAGLIAKRAFILHGVLSAAAATVLGLFALPVALQTQPFWMVLVGFVGGPVAGAAGGYLASRQARRNAELDPYGGVAQPPAA